MQAGISLRSTMALDGGNQLERANEQPLLERHTYSGHAHKNLRAGKFAPTRLALWLSKAFAIGSPSSSRYSESPFELLVHSLAAASLRQA